MVETYKLPLCISCGEEGNGGYFCRKHYLQKEYSYGLYDLKTNLKGFRWKGIKRIYQYYKYLIIKI